MWQCLACGIRSADDSATQCEAGHERRLPKGDPRKIPSVEPGVVALPSSRGPGHASHVVAVFADRTAACSTCEAAVYAQECHAKRRVERRLKNHQKAFLRDVATVKEQAFSVLTKHPEAADSDLVALKHWFRDWLGYDESTTMFSVLEDWIGSGVGNRLETFRRRCKEWIEKGFFEKSPDVAKESRWREGVWREEFSSGAPS